MPLLRTLLLGTLLTLCTRAAADEYSKTASSSSSFIDEEAVFSAALHNEESLHSQLASYADTLIAQYRDATPPTASHANDLPKSATPILVVVASSRPRERDRLLARAKASVDIAAVVRAVRFAEPTWDIVVSVPPIDGFVAICTQLFDHDSNVVYCNEASATFPVAALLGRTTIGAFHTAFSGKEYEEILSTTLVSSVLEWARMHGPTGLLTAASHSRAVWGAKLEKPSKAAHFASCASTLWDGSIDSDAALLPVALACIDPLRVSSRPASSTFTGAGDLLALVGLNATGPIVQAQQRIDTVNCNTKSAASIEYTAMVSAALLGRTTLVRIDPTFTHNPPLFAPSRHGTGTVAKPTEFVVGIPCPLIGSPPSSSSVGHIDSKYRRTLENIGRSAFIHQLREEGVDSLAHLEAMNDDQLAVRRNARPPHDAITWDWDEEGGACVTHRASGMKLDSHGGAKNGWPFLALRSPFGELASKYYDEWMCRGPSICTPKTDRLADLSLDIKKGHDCSTFRFALLDGNLQCLVRLKHCMVIGKKDGRIRSERCTRAEAPWEYDRLAGTISTTIVRNGRSKRMCLARDVRRARFLEISTKPLGTLVAHHTRHCRDVARIGTAGTHAKFVAAMSSAADARPAGHPVLIVSPGAHSRDGAMGPRCLERFSAQFPLTQRQIIPMRADAATMWANASTAVTPWHCNRWIYDERSGTIVVVDWATLDGASPSQVNARWAIELCLTRISPLNEGDAVLVHASACVAASDSRYEMQQWDWSTGSTSAAAARGTIKPRAAGEGTCLSVPPVCKGAVGAAGVMLPCRGATRGEGGSYATSLDQTWLALRRDVLESSGGALTALVTQVNRPPKCEKVTAPVFDNLDELRMARAKRSAEPSRSVFEAEYHLDDPMMGPYRNFADTYDPTPLGYLEWLYRSEQRRHTSRFEVQNEVFTVKTKTNNWQTGRPPKHVLSWGLFLPRAPNEVAEGFAQDESVSIVRDPNDRPVHLASDAAPAPDSEVWGPSIGQDGPYRIKMSKAPRNEKEARASTDSSYGAKSFFTRYCEPMLKTIAYVEKNLGPDWGVVVHIGASLEWLAPVLLAAGGNVEVGVMAADGIRTAGSMWRWLPFDDTRYETVIALDSDQSPRDGVAFKMWEAVKAFALDAPEVKGVSLLRWYRGWKRQVAENAHIGGARCKLCNNYATMQANFVGIKPRRNTYSWREALVAASLHRVIFPSDYRPWPGALDRRNTFNAPLGDHKLGWGRQLFCYGFDEYFLKTVTYWQHTMDGTGLCVYVVRFLLLLPSQPPQLSFLTSCF